MSRLGDLLRKVGILPAFTADDTLNASIENDLYDHNKVAADVVNATEQRRSSNRRLREAIHDAKMRTSPFADWEQQVKGERHRVRH